MADPFNLFGKNQAQPPNAQQAQASASGTNTAAVGNPDPIPAGPPRIGDRPSLSLTEYHLSITHLAPLQANLERYNQTPAERANNQAALNACWDDMKESAWKLFKDHVRCPGCLTSPLDPGSIHEFDQEVEELCLELMELLSVSPNQFKQETLDLIKQKFQDLEARYIRAERDNSC